jgi:hypothetical protein
MFTATNQMECGRLTFPFWQDYSETERAENSTPYQDGDT